MPIRTTPNQGFCSDFLNFFKVGVVKIVFILSILNKRGLLYVILTVYVKFPLARLPKILYYKNGSDF